MNIRPTIIVYSIRMKIKPKIRVYRIRKGRERWEEGSWWRSHLGIVLTGQIKTVSVMLVPSLPLVVAGIDVPVEQAAGKLSLKPLKGRNKRDITVPFLYIFLFV